MGYQLYSYLEIKYVLSNEVPSCDTSITKLAFEWLGIFLASLELVMITIVLL